MEQDKMIDTIDTNSVVDNPYQVVLTLEEKVKCLEEILAKVKKILYVYDKTL